MEKQKAQRTENGGKGREDRGKGRTLKMEVQVLPETCPKGFITDCDSSSFCSCCETLLKAAIQVTQCRCKPTLEMCNNENMYSDGQLLRTFLFFHIAFST